MKRCLSIILILFAIQISGQDLMITRGNPITLDGHFSPNEWGDATMTPITISGIQYCNVYYKHDGNNLNIAFAGNLQSAGYFSPEIVIDSDASGDNSFGNNDWWFHVSATDCESQGQYGNYNNCMLVRPNWLAVPNFQQGIIVDTVEIQIPFATLSISEGDSIGLLFLLNNFQTIKKSNSSANHLDPSTWSKAMIDFPSSIHQKSSLEQNLKLYPNPSRGRFSLDLSSNLGKDVTLTVLNSVGEKVIRKDLNVGSGKSSVDFDLSNQSAGIYFIQVSSGREQVMKKLIVY